MSEKKAKAADELKPERVPFADPSLPLVVVVAATCWDEPPRMRHHITRQLMRWANVLFVEMTDLHGEKWKRVSPRLCLFRCRKSHLVPTRLYANEPFTHTIINRAYARRIEWCVKSLEGPVKILFNFVYDFPEIMRSRMWDLSVYVCFDEFPRMWRDREISNRLHYVYQSHLLQCYENCVARGADLCVTPHVGLARKLRRVGSEVRILHHAHEFSVGTEEVPAEFVDLREHGVINVAFMGYIHYRLLDEWLLELLRNNDLNLNLIGPIASKYSVVPFASYSNFKHISPQIGDALAATLRQMDVLIMPYDPRLPEVDVLTTTSKLFQYVATGKPIVISDLPNFLEMPPGIIYKASSLDEFVKQVRRAHAENNSELRRRRAEIAAENTWDKRGVELHGYLREELGSRIPNLAGVADGKPCVDP